MPERTTQDYTVPSVGPRVQAALSAALAEEDEVTMGEWNEKKSRSSEGINVIIMRFNHHFINY